MGTRADFYATDMTWLGSIAWDGYPDGLDTALRECTDEAEYKASLAAFLDGRDDVTLPEAGWPWPWNDSGTTDFAYRLVDGHLMASCFGSPWFRADQEEPDRDELEGERAAFPDMTSQKKGGAPAGTKQSGIMLLGGGPL